MWHDSAINKSLLLYQAALTALGNGTAIGPLLNAVNALVADNNGAMLGAPALGGFSAATLALIPNSAHRTTLINEFSLGYGRTHGAISQMTGTYKPGIIIIGTEHAYDPVANLPCLAVEGCGLSAAWRANANPQQMANLAGNPCWANIPFDFYRNPSQHFGNLPAGHTWRRAAYVTTGGNTMADVSSMFQRAYMMEISSYPAPKLAAGQPIGPARLAFLEEVIRDCGTLEKGVFPISTLWFHGMGARFAADRERITRAFFGLLQGQPLPIPVQTNVGRYRVLAYCHNEKLVVLTVAAAYRYAPKDYWDVVGELIRPRIC